MNRVRSHRLVLVLALLAPWSACAPPSEPCSAADLSAALAGAHAGDVVQVGACRIDGAFQVPPGVTLRGRSGSVLGSVAGGSPVLDVAPSTLGTTITDLAIEVDHGGVGIRLAGSGAGAALDAERLEVRVSQGIGIGVTSASATFRDITLVGPIDASNALFAPMTPDATGAFGIVARDLGGETVTLETTHASGFAVAALSASGGTLTWHGRGSGPDVEASRGVGIALFGTDATLDSVVVDGMLAGVGIPGIAVSVADLDADAATLHAPGLNVATGEGYGVFSDHADVVLDGARFSDLGAAGIRAQGGTVTATNLQCARNGGAGLLAIDVERVDVEGGTFDAQLDRLLPSSISTVSIGDGIEIVRDPMTPGSPAFDVRLVDVSVSGNARAGITFDAANGPVTHLELVRVTADASGSGLGVVAQRTTLGAGWDAMVTRTGAAIVNDAAFVPGSVSVVGIMMPPGLVATPPSL